MKEKILNIQFSIINVQGQMQINHDQMLKE